MRRESDDGQRRWWDDEVEDEVREPRDQKERSPFMSR